MSLKKELSSIATVDATTSNSFKGRFYMIERLGKIIDDEDSSSTNLIITDVENDYNNNNDDDNDDNFKFNGKLLTAVNRSDYSPKVYASPTSTSSSLLTLSLRTNSFKYNNNNRKK